MDVTIIGTGASAMLLAQSLIRRKCCQSLRIIGPDRGVHAIRFSYWSDSAPTPFDRYADATWSSLKLYGVDGGEIRVPLSEYKYRTFAAKTWLEDQRREVRDAPGVEWVDALAEEIAPSEDRVTVYTPVGRFESQWVFSSGGAPVADPTCWQRFEGWEVSVTKPLDQDAATMLDFRTPAEGDFRFIYALPLGSHRLFVEHVSYAPCDHASYLTAHLNTRLAPSGWEVVDEERGATPAFRSSPPRRDGRHVRIGVAGGVAKTATGYAVLRMWRDAERIAEGLQTRGQPTLSPPTRGLHRVADHFFLYLLEHAPEQLPGLMKAFFTRASGDAALAFLDDRASLREQFEVARATPGWLRWWMGRH